jgi:replication factor A1
MDNGGVRNAIPVGIVRHTGRSQLKPNSNSRYIVTISVNDYSAQAWFNVFDDAAKKILGVDADILMESKETDGVKAEEVFSATNFSTWVWRVRGQQDNFQGQVRVRYSVLDAWPIDYKRESEGLVKLIQSY